MRHYHAHPLSTGYYSYETHADGLRDYSSKTSAVKHATTAAHREKITVRVYSPAGKLVARIDGRDRVEEMMQAAGLPSALDM
jgi:hypothetical protein